MNASTFTATCKTLQARPLRLSLPFKIRSETGPGDVDAEAVDTVIRRYSIVRTAHRAMRGAYALCWRPALPVTCLKTNHPKSW